MINLFFALILIFAVVWAAKKFYRPTEMADHPERYPIQPDSKISKKDLAVILAHTQRWRKEGKISREEYDRLTDICLAEMRQIPKQEKSQ